MNIFKTNSNIKNYYTKILHNINKLTLIFIFFIFVFFKNKNSMNLQTVFIKKIKYYLTNLIKNV